MFIFLEYLIMIFGHPRNKKILGRGNAKCWRHQFIVFSFTLICVISFFYNSRLYLWILLSLPDFNRFLWDFFYLISFHANLCYIHLSCFCIEQRIEDIDEDVELTIAYMAMKLPSEKEVKP